MVKQYITVQKEKIRVRWYDTAETMAKKIEKKTGLKCEARKIPNDIVIEENEIIALGTADFY